MTQCSPAYHKIQGVAGAAGGGEGVGQCLSFKVLGVETRKEVEGICGRVTGFTWVVGDTRSDLSVVEGVDTKYKKKKNEKKSPLFPFLHPEVGKEKS